MTFPPQPEYESFIPEFMRLLFSEADKVCLCRKVPEGLHNYSLTLPEAITWIFSNKATPNIYFRASAFGTGPGYTQDDCSCSRALFIDIDYGKDGHKTTSPFTTLDDVMSYLLTMPLRPSIAWHTGHGIQCAYLLDKPCVFPAGGGHALNLELYKAANDKLRTMAMGNAAFTPEHVYRVPLTINRKANEKRPDLPDIRGSLLWYEPQRRYALEQILEACEGYDIKDLIKAEAQPPTVSEVKNAGGNYKSLPQDLRDEIEDTGTECSDRLFSIIGTMVRAGYDNAFILDAVNHGIDFREKYGRRGGGLRREVETCIAKIRGGRYVYSGHASAPVQIYNEPVTVALSECQELQDAMSHMYRRYVEAAGIDVRPRVSDALRFHEHISDSNRSCVIESPCGAGKSVWAICHIACQAEEGRHVYVTETVEALHKAADMLEALAPVKAGRLHGFNDDYCYKLSHKRYTWEQCIRGDLNSKCIACEARARCAYFTRDGQEKQQVLCMTHSGFIRALEDGSALLKDAHVVIDESLSAFDTFSATLNELRSVTRINGVPADALERIFPRTHLAQSGKLGGFGITGDGHDIYASRNYVYRDEAGTSAIADVIRALRAALRTFSPELSFRPQSGNHEKARETLAALVNFFRPSARGDSTYAYRESEGKITCKRSRFSFGTAGPWNRLTMLNASASLSPFPYPDTMPVFTCPDIPENSSLVTLHCVKANPTKTRLRETVKIGDVAMILGERTRLHRRVLVCLNKDSEAEAKIRGQVKNVCGVDAEVTVLTRGRIKGVNTAGDCTLALLQGMSLFTGIDDCALHAALQYRRTFPDTEVFKADGKPKWGRNGIEVPAMRNYYALRCLDEIYQAIWRTAVRNDKPVEAVIVIPDANWLAALYRTVMPLSVVASAYEEKKGTIKVPQADGTVMEHATDFAFDEQLYGIGGLCALPPGTEITKEELASRLGYAEWERNSAAITDMLGDLFEPGSNVRYLKRKIATASV